MAASSALRTARTRTAALIADRARATSPAERTELRSALIETNLVLVDHLARSLRVRSEPLEDLRQSGVIGLIKAVDRFDPAQGCEFSTYATPVILGEMRRHVRDHGALVRVPARMMSGGWAGGPVVVVPLLDDVGHLDHDPALDPVDAHAVVSGLVTRLSPEDQHLVRWHFLEGISQTRIAESIGLTQPQVSRRLGRALSRMRDMLRADPAT